MCLLNIFINCCTVVEEEDDNWELEEYIREIYGFVENRAGCSYDFTKLGAPIPSNAAGSQKPKIDDDPHSGWDAYLWDGRCKLTLREFYRENKREGGKVSNKPAATLVKNKYGKYVVVGNTKRTRVKSIKKFFSNIRRKSALQLRAVINCCNRRRTHEPANIAQNFEIFDANEVKSMLEVHIDDSNTTKVAEFRRTQRQSIHCASQNARLNQCTLGGQVSRMSSIVILAMDDLITGIRSDRLRIVQRILQSIARRITPFITSRVAPFESVSINSSVGSMPLLAIRNAVEDSGASQINNFELMLMPFLHRAPINPRIIVLNPGENSEDERAMASRTKNCLQDRHTDNKTTTSGSNENSLSRSETPPWMIDNICMKKECNSAEVLLHVSPPSSTKYLAENVSLGNLAYRKARNFVPHPILFVAVNPGKKQPILPPIKIKRLPHLHEIDFPFKHHENIRYCGNDTCCTREKSPSCSEKKSIRQSSWLGPKKLRMPSLDLTRKVDSANKISPCLSLKGRLPKLDSRFQIMSAWETADISISGRLGKFRRPSSATISNLIVDTDKIPSSCGRRGKASRLPKLDCSLGMPVYSSVGRPEILLRILWEHVGVGISGHCIKFRYRQSRI